MVAVLCMGSQPAFADTYTIDSSGGVCTSIGTWDLDTLTCKLTDDVIGSIQIYGSSGVTLDGNGHKVTSPTKGSGVGIWLIASTEVTIKNVIVQNFLHGMSLGSSTNSNTLIGNTISSSGSVGIRLNYSNNNTLEGNTFSNNNSHGVWLSYSNNNTLTGNTATNNSEGIYLDNSSYNTLTGNTTSDNNFAGISLGYSSSYNTLTDNIALNNSNLGISINNSSYNTLERNTTSNNTYGISVGSNSIKNTLTGNTVSSNSYLGIILNSSGNNTLTENTMSGNAFNFHVDGNSISDFENTIDTTNTVEGKPIYYVVGANGEVYDSSTNAGVFYAIKCSNIIIKDLTLGNNYSAVFLMDTHDSTIENVNASNDNSTGIFLIESTFNTLTGNITSSNSYYGIRLYNNSNDNILEGNITSNNNIMGIFIDGSNSNILTGNTISMNISKGLNLTSSNWNQIYNNNFIDNNVQVFIHGSFENDFDKDPPIGGNFWSDYQGTDTDGDGIGQTAYTFAGGQDNFPWVDQDGWNIDSDGDGIPDDQDDCPDEDATGFDIDGDGCIDNMSGLAEMLETLVAEGIIAEELQNSLLSKVENAEKSADKDNICAAFNKLEALINEVNAQRGKKISDEAADLIIEYANSVISWLLDQLPPDDSC
jgi:parallel beta-helix repeat protein